MPRDWRGLRDHPMSGPDSYDFSKEVVIVYAMAGSMMARPHGVRSLSVSPGAVETPLLGHFYDTMGADLLDRLKAQSGGRNALPEDVARVIAFALSEDAAWINGSDIVVDGGAGSAFHFNLTDVSAADSADGLLWRLRPVRRAWTRRPAGGRASRQHPVVEVTAEVRVSTQAARRTIKPRAIGAADQSWFSMSLPRVTVKMNHGNRNATRNGSICSKPSLTLKGDFQMSSMSTDVIRNE